MYSLATSARRSFTVVAHAVSVGAASFKVARCSISTTRSGASLSSSTPTISSSTFSCSSSLFPVVLLSRPFSSSLREPFYPQSRGHALSDSPHQRRRHVDYRSDHTVVPRRIYFIRHGQAHGNVDASVFERVPDPRVTLTEKGREEARRCGKLLSDLIGDEGVKMYVSPYIRAQQTCDEIAQTLLNRKRRRELIIQEEPRLREQDFGNFQNVDAIKSYKKERETYGSFYYRFPQGESGADAFERAASFLESLDRDLARGNVLPNIVVVGHGIIIRLILMKYFGWTVETFHRLWNPSNCELIVLEKVRQPTRGFFSVRNEPEPFELITPIKMDEVADVPREAVLQRLLQHRAAGMGDPEGFNPALISQEQYQEHLTY